MPYGVDMRKVSEYHALRGVTRKLSEYHPLQGRYTETFRLITVMSLNYRLTEIFDLTALFKNASYVTVSKCH
jgi:hypothetical protein